MLASLFAGSEVWVLGVWESSALQACEVPSTSNPSRTTRILPQESQFGGTRTRSRSMTLCFKACFLSWEWMPRVEWIRVGRELGWVGEVYIREAPSGKRG